MPIWARYTVIAAATLLVVPTVAGASSIVVSLVQGKTPAEAVQILADQIDSLTKRVTKLEERQTKTEELTEQQQLGQEEIAETLEESNAELLQLRNQLDATVTGSKQDRERLRDELSRSISDLTRDRDLLRQQLSISKSDLSGVEKEKSSLTAQVADLQKKVRCQELITRTPIKGDVTYLQKNIVKFYEQHIQLVEEREKLGIVTEVDAIILKDQKIARDGAKPMYDAYKKECGDYNPS
ncbi:MAG: hypothetical protein WAP74_04635 [Patescibacteria group bacterium]